MSSPIPANRFRQDRASTTAYSSYLPIWQAFRMHRGAPARLSYCSDPIVLRAVCPDYQMSCLWVRHVAPAA
jgi:hypothetical protein